MNIYRLENYRSIVRQISIFENDISYISAVDTTNVSVQSGKISKPTEDMGIRLAYYQEYERLCKERDEILKYIIHISDENVKEIAMRKFIKGQTYDDIAKAMNYDRRTISRKLNKYINNNKNAHNAH